MQKLLTFFQQKYYHIFDDKNFNNKFTYNIISFEQLGSDQTNLWKMYIMNNDDPDQIRLIRVFTAQKWKNIDFIHVQYDGLELFRHLFCLLYIP